MRHLSAASFVALTFLTATGAAAQKASACDLTKSFDACFQQKVQAQVQAQTTSAVSKAADAATSVKATGSAGSSAAGTSTATNDFLPQFASAFSLPGFAGPGKGLDLETNKKLSGISAQLKAVSQEPQILDALVANIPQKTRSAAKDSITKTLGDLDNVKLSLSANVESGHFGRWSTDNAAWISKLTSLVIDSLAKPIVAGNEAFQEQVMKREPVSRVGDCAATPTRRPLSCYSTADQQGIEAAADTFAGQYASGSAAMHTALMTARLDKLEDLLNNQDQLTFSAAYVAEQRVIGPNVATASIRWEIGLVNLSRLKGECGEFQTPACYAEYVKRNVGALDQGDRFWLEADLTQTRAYDFALAVDSARVVKPSSLAFEPTVGYGRYFGGGQQRLRADLGIQYRFSDKQAVRQNRWASTLALTQKLSDQSSAVLSFIWADHPDFVGTVDKNLRANVGLSYKISKPGS